MQVGFSFLVILASYNICAQRSARPVEDDVFSSVAKMEALVHQEDAIVNMLDAFLIESKQRIHIIQEWVVAFFYNTKLFIACCIIKM